MKCWKQKPLAKFVSGCQRSTVNSQRLVTEPVAGFIKSLAEMKYELTTSITAKCGLLTSKVNFVVTIAFRYALRATYFITQRAEAHLKVLRRGLSSMRRKTQEIRKLENQITGEIKSLRSKQGLRLCSPRRNLESSQMTWIKVYDCCKFTCIKT